MRWRAHAPALLLPVRLETRYVAADSGLELRVRMYPDQVSIDTHEPELTDSEVTAGTIYWETVWYAGTVAAGETKRKAAWQALATAYGPQRGAWIARELEPANLSARPASPLAPGSSPKPDIPAPDQQDRRDSSWERAPLAAGLPDFWVVAAYADGQERHRVTSNPVARQLAAGPEPRRAVSADPKDLQMDPGMLWMVDFDEAERLGMAVRIPLPEDASAPDDEDQYAFDRLVVVGLRSNVPAPSPTHVPDTDPGTGAPLLQALLEAHHYTDGLALVPQGTHTNNTTEGTSGYSRRDPGHERSYAFERNEPLELVDGRVAAFVLGVPEETFEHVEHADRTDQVNARAMALAQWPATLGYFLRQIMWPEFTVDEEQDVRRWFLSNVCARGHVPGFRVGDTPYGVLPVTSLAEWTPEDPGQFEEGLITFLRKMLDVWRRSAEGVPCVRRDDDDPDADLVGLLGMEASAQSFRGRHVLGDEFLDATFRLLRIGDEFVVTRGVSRALLVELGYTDLEPRVLNFGFYDRSFELSYPTVQEEALSETDPLDEVDMEGTKVNYISWMRLATVDDIQQENYPEGRPPNALLYRVLRQAVLTEYANLAFELNTEVGNVRLEDMREPELVGFPGRGPTLTPWTVLSSEAPGITAPGQSMGEFLHALPEGTPSTPDSAGREEHPVVARLHQLRWALEWLAGLPTAELERLFGETLDACSHRLDAWLTGVAYQRLLRRRQGASALHLGAFGYVEDVRPAGATPAVTGAESDVVREIDQEWSARHPGAPLPPGAREAGGQNGGFIHAPSLTQSAAGAVLRNGHLTHHDRTDGKLLAIDLSSERVRVALSLLDGIRQGQSLAALLGYRFETALYRRGLGTFVQAFRSRYPVVANKLTPSNEPAEAVAASNVVDGEALHREWTDGSFSWSAGLPPAGAARDKATAALEELTDAVDALGDLSISESVYQILQGNYGRAGGLLDAISRGERPPDPEVVQTPRGGTDVTHRLMLLMTGTPVRAGQWPGAGRPRAQAEPLLDAWLSTVLPRPDKVRVRVAYRDMTGAQKELGLRLGDLGMGPLDALAVADAADQPQSSELEQRILFEALERLAGIGTDPRLTFERAQGWQLDELSFPEWLVTAKAARELVTGARPLGPEDLVEPERGYDSAAALDEGNDALDTRAGKAVEALGEALTDLGNAITGLDASAPATVDTLRDRLFDASFLGVSGAIPFAWKPVGEAAIKRLREQAEATAKELERRKDAADKLDKVDRTKLSADGLRDHLVATLQAVFGPAFAVIAPFRPPDGDSLEKAFGASGALLGSDAQAPARWLDQLAHVRPGAGRYQTVTGLCELLDAPRPKLTLGQLPFRQGDRWLGLPAAAGAPPVGGRVALAAELPVSYSKTALHGGLLIDSWPERIPSATQTTGISFHYNQPGNRAPQTCLVAVCPDEREDWSFDLLLSTVADAIEVAKIRMVDLDTLAEVGQIGPPLYFPFNASNETVSGSADWIT